MSYAQNIWNFTYDSNGMRTRRSNSGTGDTYTYVYNGSQLSRMTYGSNTMWFAYGADGSPLTITYNGATYYYVTNIQGDVVAILNNAGTAVVNYTYDAWGKPLATTGSMANTLGMVNPLRYRGYVYDRETGLYYLQSRYYNPTWGRFLNSDSLLCVSEFTMVNLFAYCLNNPVVYYDSSGHIAAPIPMITGGLNLPITGGLPVEIRGVTYFYAIDIQNGQLYEYWFDADGNLIWGRHHTDHNKPWKHTDPHDHQGGKDKDGNNTLVNGPQPVDNNFHAPEQSVSGSTDYEEVGYVVVGVVVGVAIYQVTKWALATFLAPATGGSSYLFAGLTP